MRAATADCAFSSGRGLRFKQRGVHIGKIFQFQSWNFLPNEMFDCLQSGQFFTVHESERIADILRPAGASDAVHIIFRMLRHIVIDDVAYARNVEPARRDIGGHHHFVFAALESFERFDPFPLGPVGMQDRDRVLSLLQLMCDAIGAVLWFCKKSRRCRNSFAPAKPLGDRISAQQPPDTLRA